jgi:hypothetical protein
MIINEINFIISDKGTSNFVVHVGEKIKVEVRVSGEEKTEILNGEIRGAYLDADEKYRIAIYGRYENRIAVKENELHLIYLPFIREWQY